MQHVTQEALGLGAYREEFAVCAASHAVGRPVKWIEDRSESTMATIHGRAQVQYYEAGVDDSGRIVALRFEALIFVPAMAIGMLLARPAFGADRD